MNLDEELSGGNMGRVVRRGEVVIRPAGAWTPAVHRLLNHLNDAGVGGVPRPVGTADGKEQLTFVAGEVPAYPLPVWVWGETALLGSAQLLRRLHDATAGATIAGPWRSPVHEPVEVICHNDFAPYNLVFRATGELDDRAGEVVGVIDWDFASPGPRLWDLAYLAYRIVPLSHRDHADGFSMQERGERLRRLIVGYGLDEDPAALEELLVDRLLELADHSDRMATVLGDPELHEHATLYRHDAAHLVTDLQ